MVMAESYGQTTYWTSNPDSGYSVDNLPPRIPAPFVGQYAAGSTRLTWSPNAEPDFALYRLYRGATPGFVPGAANLVTAKPDTGFVDVAGAPYYYKLAAEDVHGNLSGFATLLPAGTLGAPGGASVAFALAGARPNPARGDRLSVEFTLPSALPATLELLDVGGRRVATRDVGALGAGPHAVDLAAGRRLAPGLYLVRLAQGAASRTARVIVVE